MRILASVVAAAFVVAPAVASDFLFTLSGSGFSGWGTITIDESISGENRWNCGACATGPGYLITDISGIINGASLELIARGTISGNSNYLYLAGPYLDLDGLGIKIGGSNYDLFEGSNRGQFSYFLIGGRDGLWDNPVEFEITQDNSQNENEIQQNAEVPEPKVWMTSIIGFILIGKRLRSRKKWAFMHTAPPVQI